MTTSKPNIWDSDRKQDLPSVWRRWQAVKSRMDKSNTDNDMLVIATANDWLEYADTYSIMAHIGASVDFHEISKSFSKEMKEDFEKVTYEEYGGWKVKKDGTILGDEDFFIPSDILYIDWIDIMCRRSVHALTRNVRACQAFVNIYFYALELSGMEDIEIEKIRSEHMEVLRKLKFGIVEFDYKELEEKYNIVFE